MALLRSAALCMQHLQRRSSSSYIPRFAFPLSFHASHTISIHTLSQSSVLHSPPSAPLAGAVRFTPSVISSDLQVLSLSLSPPVLVHVRFRCSCCMHYYYGPCIGRSPLCTSLLGLNGCAVFSFFLVLVPRCSGINIGSRSRLFACAFSTLLALGTGRSLGLVFFGIGGALVGSAGFLPILASLLVSPSVYRSKCIAFLVDFEMPFGYYSLSLSLRGHIWLFCVCFGAEWEIRAVLSMVLQ